MRQMAFLIFLCGMHLLSAQSIEEKEEEVENKYSSDKNGRSFFASLLTFYFSPAFLNNIEFCPKSWLQRALYAIKKRKYF